MAPGTSGSYNSSSRFSLLTAPTSTSEFPELNDEQEKASNILISVTSALLLTYLAKNNVTYFNAKLIKEMETKNMSQHTSLQANKVPVFCFFHWES